MLDHDPSFEWPGTSSRANSPIPGDLPGHAHSTKASWVTMRLLVIKSSILSKKHRIAVVDGYPEVQFGRDVAPAGNDAPRIRLKEMEVSKFHATAFWDVERREWAIVDMGSKHGTYLKSSEGGSNIGESTEIGIRLSPTKMASIPRRIRHLDILTIGSTTFQVHIHDGQIPCTDCSPKGGDEISLFPIASAHVRDEGSASKRSLNTAGLEENAPRPKDPKKALAMLRHALLTRRDSDRESSTDSKTRYADRSAARRSRQSGSCHDPPGVSLPRLSSESSSPSPAPVPAPSNEDEAMITSAPPAPIPATNFGHRLLLKQGWQPGTSLGIHADTEDDSGLLEPLELSSTRDRAGLGMTREQSSVRPGSWREIARQKRWEDVRLQVRGNDN